MKKVDFFVVLLLCRMLVEGMNRCRVSAAIAPRKINVQKYAESRAVELQSLHSIVANRVGSDFRAQRNKRRRTTSYDTQNGRARRKRRKLGMFDKGNASPLGKKVHVDELPRRVRRRMELKMNPESGFCCSGDGTRRLRTHVWHAKRFTMTKLWGYHLPLGLQGRYCYPWFRIVTLISNY